MRDYDDEGGLTVADIDDLCGRSMQRSVRRRNQEMLRKLHRTETWRDRAMTVLIVVLIVAFLMALRSISGA